MAGLSLAGATVCVTGLGKDERAYVQHVTEMAGGVYSRELHKGCTQLVVADRATATPKLECAQRNAVKWGMRVVTLSAFLSAAASPPTSSALPPAPPSSNWPVVQHNPTPPTLRITSPTLPTGRFVGMVLFVDAAVEPAATAAVREAVVKGGGHLSDNYLLGGRTTHAVCALHGDNAAAVLLRYVALGLSVVTPQWVLAHSRPTGASAERRTASCVSISRDAARTLVAFQPAASEARRASVGLGLPDGDGDNETQWDAAAREALVRQAKAERRARRAAGQPHAQPLQPPALLEGLSWAVDEPVEAATIFCDHPASHCPDAMAEADALGMPAAADGSLPRITDRELDAVVYRAPFVTLLFPLDRFCEGVQVARTLHCPLLSPSGGGGGGGSAAARGLSRRQLLAYISAFYDEPLTAHETRLAVFTDSTHADALQRDWAASGERWRRVALLGSLKYLDGLRRLAPSAYKLSLTA